MATPWQSSAWVDVGQESDRLVLQICGELDLGSRPTVEPAVAAAVRSCAAVTLDLKKLTFCDSQGLAMFVEAHQLAAGCGAVVEISGAAPTLRRLFAITGDDRTVSLVD